MADERSITIGTQVSPNDLADDLPALFDIGTVVGIETRHDKPYRVRFGSDSFGWFDAEELDVLTPPPPPNPQEDTP